MQLTVDRDEATIESDAMRYTYRQIDWTKVKILELEVYKGRSIFGKRSKNRNLPKTAQLTPINVRIILITEPNQGPASRAASKLVWAKLLFTI